MDNTSQSTQNIISMSDYNPESGYAAIAQVEAYWEALRNGNTLPKRSEIDPRGIEQALENVFIVERIAPGVARLRIAGNHLSDLMGMEVRGMPLTSIFSVNARRAVSDMLEDVFQRPASCTIALSSAGSAGRPALEGRMVLLPLRSDLGDTSRVLGCFVTKGEIGAGPRRFDVVGRELSPLFNTDNAEVTRPPAVRPKRMVEMPEAAKEFAAPQVVFNGEGNDNDTPHLPAKDKRPAYLRLVKSDE